MKRNSRAYIRDKIIFYEVKILFGKQIFQIYKKSTWIFKIRCTIVKSTSLSFYSLDYAIQGTHSDFLCNSSFHEIVICILSIKCNIFV